MLLQVGGLWKQTLRQNCGAVCLLEGIHGRFGQSEESNGDRGPDTSSHRTERGLWCTLPVTVSCVRADRAEPGGGGLRGRVTAGGLLLIPPPAGAQQICP